MEFWKKFRRNSRANGANSWDAVQPNPTMGEKRCRWMDTKFELIGPFKH